MKKIIVFKELSFAEYIKWQISYSR